MCYTHMEPLGYLDKAETTYVLYSGGTFLKSHCSVKVLCSISDVFAYLPYTAPSLT